jgi:hypothetical protein
MRIFSRNLIVIVTLISQGCAHVPVIQPSSMFVDKGFQPIEKENPPTNGVWATWDDARSLANNNRLERLELARRNIELSSQNELLSKKIEMKEIESQQYQTGYKSWLAHWGIPLGLLCGIGLGIGVAVGVKK